MTGNARWKMWIGSASLFVAAALVTGATTAVAQIDVTVSTDVAVDLAGTVYHDEDVVSDDQLGTLVQESLGLLPPATDVMGFEQLANGDRLFTLDTTVDLPGGVTLFSADVARYDGATYTIEFDGSAEGVPIGARPDAVTVDSVGNLLLSFDTTVDLAGTVAADEDLVSFDGLAFSIVFDGSAEGLPQALDLDGASIDASGNITLSLDGSGSVGGVDFDDEDVLEFQPGGSWSLLYDGDASHTSLGPADVNSVLVPEPNLLVQLLAGAALLTLIGRSRVRE